MTKTVSTKHLFYTHSATLLIETRSKGREIEIFVFEVLQD